jgi:tRNA modification GTPase
MSEGGAAKGVRWRLATPSRAGAIAIIELVGASSAVLDEAIERIGVGRLDTGEVQLRSLAGVDRGLAVRWSGVLVHLMPHGGSAVVRKLLDTLTEMGIEPADEGARVQSNGQAQHESYPEANDETECRMLEALSHAQSPLAVDVLLAQPARWRSHGGGETAPRELDRLINPPLVVVRGPANVGKSTLVNALAGRAVSVVADEPGTTRDHVGVMVDVAGLVVRLLDLPGERGRRGDEADVPDVEREAMALASNLAERADLTLWCGDQDRAPNAASGEALAVALKADLGPCPWPSDFVACAHNGQGLAQLVEAVRDRLVPPASLADPRPWRFWGDSG